MNDLLLMKASKIKVFDGFNRANSALTMGNADTGQTWTALVGTWGIASNQAYAAATVEYFAKAVIESNLSNALVSVVITNAASNYPRLTFRVSDALNEWVIANNSTNKFSLSKRVGGTSIQVAVNASYSVVNGTKLSVLLNGDNIKVFFNDIPVFDITDNFNNTATKHGIQVYNGIAMRFDNFKMEAI